MSIGKNFIAAITAAQSLSDFFTFGPIDHLFKGSEVEVWDFVSEFIKKYGELPKAETIQTHTSVALPETAEPAAYYLDLMRIRHQELCIKAAMKKAQDQLQPGGAGSEAALTQITQMVLNLLTQDQAHQVSDLRTAHKLLIDHYAATNHGSLSGVKLGWPYFDEMSGGVRKSDLVSMVGRPGIGKTWQMLYCRLHRLGCRPKPTRRTPWREPACSSRWRWTCCRSSSAWPRCTRRCKMSRSRRARCRRVELKTLQEGPEGAGGLQGPVLGGRRQPDGDGRRRLPARQAAEAERGLHRRRVPDEAIRPSATATSGCPRTPICSRIRSPTRSARSSPRGSSRARASKKKKGEEVTLDDIAHADAIGMDSSIVMGVFEEETVETLKQRRVKILKGRNGETGEFLTNWYFDKMDFCGSAQAIVGRRLQFV